MTKPLNVLITSAGRRVELVDMFKAATDGLVIAADMDATAPALYRADAAARLPSVADPSFEEAFRSLCAEHEVGLVVPTIDTELPRLSQLAWDRNAVDGTRIAISRPETICASLDKMKCATVLSEAGVPVVPTEIWVRDTPSFPPPWVVKPRRGAAATGVRVIDSADLWTAAPSDDWLVQPRVVGPETTIDVIAAEPGKVTALGARRRLKVRGGEVERAVTLAGDQFVELAGLVGRALGLEGPFNFQVFHCESSGKVLLGDLNPRFGGGAPLSERAGANLAALTCDWARTGMWSSELSIAGAGVVMARYDQSVFLEEDALLWR